MYTQPSADKAAVAVDEESFEVALSALLRPVVESRKALMPASDEEENQREAGAASNGGVAFIRAADGSKFRLGEPQRRSETEKEGLEQPQIPRMLAEALADTAVVSKLTRAAAAEGETAFAFWEISASQQPQHQI
ncbi:hypothetical protein Esti_001141 [Eimeria stiedai]